MDDYVVKRLALVLAVNSEIEGMKVANIERMSRGRVLAYCEKSFFDAAKKLREIAYKHEEEL